MTSEADRLRFARLRSSPASATADDVAWLCDAVVRLSKERAHYRFDAMREEDWLEEVRRCGNYSAEIIADTRRALARESLARMTPAEMLALSVRAGIHNPDGSLRPPYDGSWDE